MSSSGVNLQIVLKCSVSPFLPRIFQLFLAASALLFHPTAASAGDYTGGGFVTIAPERTKAYIAAYPDAEIAVENFKLENGETLSVMHDPDLPDRMLTSATDSRLDFEPIVVEARNREIPCIDLKKDMYIQLHGSREMGAEFKFAHMDKREILGSTDDLVNLLAEINRAQPGVLQRNSNVGVASCYFEAVLLQHDAATCSRHFVNTSAALKMQFELMHHDVLKELEINVISLSSEGKVFTLPKPLPPGGMLERAVCEQVTEIRLFEEMIGPDGKRPEKYLRPITPKLVGPDALQKVLLEGMDVEHAYTELYIRRRRLVTSETLHRIDEIAKDVTPYIIKRQRFPITPAQIAPPSGSGLVGKVFAKGMLFLDVAFSLWEVGKVTYHSVAFYNEHTGAVEGIARAAVMEDKWRSDLAGQIEDIKRLQYQEDGKWALSMLNYLLAVQAEKEELFAYWEKEGIPREQFLDTHKLVNLNQKIINILYKMRGTESFGAIDPKLRSTAWKINLNPLFPGGTYYDPSWQPQPRPNLEELILIPDVREELLKIISDLDCDRAKRFLGGKTSDELGHADLIALLGFIGSQAYQELVDAAALVQKPNTEFLDSVTKGWGRERKQAIENENRDSDERVYFNPAVWIGISGPGKLGEEYFSFLP